MTARWLQVAGYKSPLEDSTSSTALSMQGSKPADAAVTNHQNSPGTHLVMGVADCTACTRRHDWPVNSKCLYVKAALQKCVLLGAPHVDFMLHLPEIGALPEEGEVEGEDDHAAAGLRRPLEGDIIRLLIRENEESRRLLEVSQTQMDAMLKQMQELTAQLRVSGSNSSDANGAQAGNSSVLGNQPPVGAAVGCVTPAAPSVSQGGFPPAAPGVSQGAARIIPPGFHPSYLMTQSQTAFNNAVQTEYPMGRGGVLAFQPWTFNPELHGLHSAPSAGMTSQSSTLGAGVRYDQAAREKAELLGPSSFMYGDHELVHTFLGLDQLKL